MKCRKCGKDCLDVDEDGLCEDCRDSDDEDDEDMTSEEMDDFATMVLNSPLSPLK